MLKTRLFSACKWNPSFQEKQEKSNASIVATEEKQEKSNASTVATESSNEKFHQEKKRKKESTTPTLFCNNVKSNYKYEQPNRSIGFPCSFPITFPIDI